MAGKPDTRIVLKNKATGASVTLASFWTDGERPSGGLDRRVTRIKVEWQDQDGTTHTEVVTNAGKDSSHYCNLWADAAQPQQRAAPPQRQQPARKPAPELPPDDVGDDIPF